MKICNKCKIEKDLSGFSKDVSRKDGLKPICKKCANEYNKKWNEKNTEYKKKWYKENSEYVKERSKKRYEKNTEHVKEQVKERSKSKAKYAIYASQISWINNAVRNVDEFLQTKCTYCSKWFFPTISNIKNRISALNGQVGNGETENRLYCSPECKQACPIYRKKKFQEGHPLKNKNISREVQPELRQLVFERDEYICIKCRKHQDELSVPLHCHHIEGIQQNPIESADIDMCVTVCKDCHNEIHQQEGCGYNDMKCKIK